MNLGRMLCALAAVAALAPAPASAHFGHHHHHHGVMLKGTVTSVDTSNDTLVVKVAKATRGGAALVGDNVTVKAVKGWVADTNNDGKHSIADVKDGDTVLLFTKRRFIDGDNVSAAFVVDKSSARDAFRSGDGDWHHCDGDHR